MLSFFYRNIPPPTDINAFFRAAEREVNDDPGDDLTIQGLGPKKWRTIIISDVHLLTSSAQARSLLQFLLYNEADTLILNGDIVDFWSKERTHSRAQATFFQKILRRDRDTERKKKTIYIPGNHEQPIRRMLRLFGTVSAGNNILVTPEAIHTTADGKRYLISHGDEHDGVVRGSSYLEAFGTKAYGYMSDASFLIDRWRDNTHFNHLCQSVGLGRHWSFAHAARKRSDKAGYGYRFQLAAATRVARHNRRVYLQRKQNPTSQEPYLDGFVHGHNHITDEHIYITPHDPETGAPMGPKTIHSLNAGHWTGRPIHPSRDSNVESDQWIVESNGDGPPSCVAIVEGDDGALRRIQWIFNEGPRDLTLNSDGKPVTIEAMPQPRWRGFAKALHASL